MTTRQLKRSKGVSLIEAMIAILVLSIVVIGTSGYRYYATLDARKADVYITAARIGHLLCESWRAVKGADAYDPTVHLDSDLTITASDGPDAPEDFTLLGSYKVVLNDFDCYITISWKDVSTGLKALNVVLVWPQRGQGGNGIDDADKSFRLTAYAALN